MIIVKAFERRRHDRPRWRTSAAQMHRLVYGAALEEVVALVGAAPGVEEREHAGDQERRLVVRDGVGTREDRGCLPVFAVRVCEKSDSAAVKALSSRQLSPTKQRSTIDPLSMCAFSAAMKS